MDDISPMIGVMNHACRFLLKLDIYSLNSKQLQ